MPSLRVGVVNRYTAEKRRRYPLGLALERCGATYVPVDVRDITASLDERGAPSLMVPGGAGELGTSLDELKLDGIAWRVSEDAFHAYADIQELLAQRYVMVNDWACARTCASKWRTSVRLAAAGIRVVPTVLVVPGMKVPAFSGAETVIKPCVGAGGRGVRLAEAGTDPRIVEPYVAQPLLGGTTEQHVRALVCGFSSVLTMFREPGEQIGRGGVLVNNLAAGGVPRPAPAEPVRDIALAVANHLDGDLLGVDLALWEGDWAVLEVNASPGLDGIAQVAGADSYRIAADAVIGRLRRAPRVAVTSGE